MSDVFISYSRKDIAFARLADDIPDFQALVDWCKDNGCADTQGSQREQWITALKSGKNPFDAQLLLSLRNP